MKADLFWVEGFKLAIMPRLRGGDWLGNEVNSYRAQGVDVLVSLITEEEMFELEIEDEPALAAEAGLEFHHEPLRDRGVPEDSPATLAFIDLLASRARAGKGVAIHCRGGIGRSGTIAALVLWRLGTSVEEAFENLGKARRCPVPDTDEQRVWAQRFSERFSQGH